MTQFLDSAGAQRIVSKLREQISGKAASNHKHNVTINGVTKTLLGETPVDLGKYLTAHQSLDGYVNNIVTQGSGNIITSVTKNGKTLTFNKGLTLNANLFIIPTNNKLPTEVSQIENNRIYLIKAGIAATNDSYVEYIYTGSPASAYDSAKWEKLGEVKVNMDNYYTKTEAGNTFAAKSHTHNYAGSGSAGGSANSAAKLDTATAGSTTQPVYFKDGKPAACGFTVQTSVPAGAKFTDTNTWRGIQNNLTSDAADQSLSAAQGKVLKGLVDGKANANHTHRIITFVGSEVGNSAGWYKFGSVTDNTYGNNCILLAVTSTFQNTFTGILSINVRYDGTTPTIQVLNWLVRKGFAAGSIIAVISGSTVNFYVKNDVPQYGQIAFEVLYQSSRTASNSNFKLINNSTKETTTPKASVTATDGGIVNYANSAGTANSANSANSVAWNNVSGKPSTFTPSAHTHNNIVSRGRVSAESGGNDIAVRGLSMQEAYSNNYPSQYGNVLNLRGDGQGQILAGWSGKSGAVERLYYRNKRDTTEANWSAWKTVAFTDDKPATAGTADTAKKLDTTSAGSTTKPVYFSNGVPVECGFTVQTSVPAGAKFTDTTYGVATTSANGLMSSGDKNTLNKLNRISGEINLADLDLKDKIANYLTTGVATRLNVIGTYNGNNAVVGVLEIYSDAWKHQVTEVFTTCLIPTSATGSLREFDKIDISAHTDEEIYTYFRVYNNNMPSGTITKGTWSKWKEIGGSRVRDYVNVLVSEAVSTGHKASDNQLSLLKDSAGRGYVDVSTLVIPTSTIDSWF